MALTVRGLSPISIFGLHGTDENSATFALGWVIEKSPEFRRLVALAIFGELPDLDVADATIAVQKHDIDGGFTDLELAGAQRFHAIVEAKRGWEIPSIEQFSRYCPRLRSVGAKLQRLVSVSAAAADQALRALPKKIAGVCITHLSWGQLQHLSRKALASTSSFEERLWLRQLDQHLQEFVSMDRVTSNDVFVVSLSTQPINDGREYTWIDIVEKDHSYFHPVGNTWPVEPPNYIGFRYHGKLQSVHHIGEFQIVDNVSKVSRNWCKTDGDHFVYRLGPAMLPVKEVRTGHKIFRNMRVWCAIDTLLSGEFPTIGDARDETQRRLSENL